IEQQRQQVTVILAGGAGVLLTGIATLRFSIVSAPLALIVVAIGIFGWLFLEIFETKWEETKARRNFYRLKIEAIANLDSPLVESSPGRLRKAWRLIFAGFMLAGLISLIITILLAVSGLKHPQGSSTPAAYSSQSVPVYSFSPLPGTGANLLR